MTPGPPIPADPCVEYRRTKRMRSVPGMLHRQLLVAVVLALVGALVSGAPAFAATGSVTSTATPSDAAPGVGQQIVVANSINVSGVDAPDNKLGASPALEWNPAVLAYNSHRNRGRFHGVVNPANAATGRCIQWGQCQRRYRQCHRPQHHVRQGRGRAPDLSIRRWPPPPPCESLTASYGD